MNAPIHIVAGLLLVALAIEANALGLPTLVIAGIWFLATVTLLPLLYVAWQDDLDLFGLRSRGKRGE
jgi:hypothetical protein